MTSPLSKKQHIADLAELLIKTGVSKVIICPGSRNAPLIQVLERDDRVNCYSIVDERSAGYVAMGMAKECREPVAVVTTSGTAALNLSPAVAEAFSQDIPLIVITADRPEEFPGQFTNQRINQPGIFEKNIKAFGYSIAEPSDEEEQMEFIERAVELLSYAIEAPWGPVHLNLVLEEPLYESIPSPSPYLNELSLPDPEPPESWTDEEIEILDEAISGKQKILFIAGMGYYSDHEKELLALATRKLGTVVLTENISNLADKNFITIPEQVFALSEERKIENLQPDLVISYGGPVISKRTRLFVQSLEEINVISTKIFPSNLLEQHLKASDQSESGNSYLDAWKKNMHKASNRADKYLGSAPYSNLTVMFKLLREIPTGAVVHLGNSSAVRYSQMCTNRNDLTWHSNRGTSGIDGCLSTAVGAAMISGKLHVAIVGDLSFIYDSNALWNNEFPENLRIIVVNDGGGGIFRLLDGPDKMPFFEKFSVTSHPVSIVQLSGSFGKKAIRVSDMKSFAGALNTFFDDRGSSILIEVDTTGCENSRIFKEYFKTIHNQ